MNDQEAFLRRHRKIALDSCVFIYVLELTPRYSAMVGPVLEWIEHPGHRAITSTVALTEILVKPYAIGDASRIDEARALLNTYPNLDWIAPSLRIAEQAARLRALHRLKTPDALLAATAVSSGATGFVTNDPAFARVTEFETLLLDRLI